MSPGERGPLPLSELLAKEGYRRKRMVKSEAHHGLERASQLACFSDEQICSNSEPQHWSDLERNKLYEHSSSKKDRFSDQRMHLSKEKTGSTYKSRNYLLNGETPKRVYRSASLEHWKYKSGDYSKYPANDSFEEENSDTCWKSGSLSSEPLIHHKVDGYIKRKSWICSQDKAIDPRKSNMDIKGKTWICSQDKPESPRKIYDKFGVKSQAKVPKSIRQSLLAEKNIDKDLEFINGGNSLHENTRHDVRNSVLTNNRLKDISDRGKHLKSEKSFPGSSHELESVERRPLVDQDALQAVVLVISGYISQFMRDKSFRKTLGLHCHSCIGFDHQSKYGDDDFVVNMKRAIVCVGNVADGSTNADELKRTKFQLCAIADLNSDDFKYGFTCGIPNSCLAACAHLYLGILAKIQRKDKAAVKHILQVFSSAPFQARSLLLSELWEYLFLPHLLYLRVWYSQEVDFVDHDSNGSGKIKFIDKVYNKLLDNGTYQLAVYYREWLSNRAEAPAILSVGIPFGLAYGNLNQESHDTSTAEERLRINGACSLQPTITKGLFDAVFGYSSKTNFSDEVIHGKGKCSFDSCTRSFSYIIDKNDQADNQSHVVLDGGGQVTLKESLDISVKQHGQLLAADESWELPKAVSAASKELMENQNVQVGDAVSEKALILPVSHGLSSDLALKKLAETAFKSDKSETFNCSLSAMDGMMNNLVAEGDGTSRVIRKGSTSRTIESPYESSAL